MTAISHNLYKGITEDTTDVQNFASAVCLAIEQNLVPTVLFKRLTTCFRGHCKHGRYESSPSISQLNIIKLFYSQWLLFLLFYDYFWRYYHIWMSTLDEHISNNITTSGHSPQFSMIFLPFWRCYQIWMSTLDSEHIFQWHHHQWAHPPIFYDFFGYFLAIFA